jgi:hypothetical protein
VYLLHLLYLSIPSHTIHGIFGTLPVLGVTLEPPPQQLELAQPQDQDQPMQQQQQEVEEESTKQDLLQ